MTLKYRRTILKNCMYWGSEGLTSLVSRTVMTTMVPSDSLLLSRVSGLSSSVRRVVVNNIVPSKMYFGRLALWVPSNPFLT